MQSCIELQSSGERGNSEKPFSPPLLLSKTLQKSPKTAFLYTVSLSYWLMVSDQFKLCHLNNYQMMSYQKVLETDLGQGLTLS